MSGTGASGELPGGNGQDERPNSAQKGGLKSEKSDRSRKQRLHWDEENLRSNELEIERNPPKMRIDEPKTPYHASSEAGSSTSGSAPQSPGSPTWIERDKLVGFGSAEKNFKAKGGASSGSAGKGSANGSSGTKSVHIVEDPRHSRGSSGEFERKRKLHYHNEFPRRPLRMDGDDSDDSIVNAAERLSCDSGIQVDQNSPPKRMKDTNGSVKHDKDSHLDETTKGKDSEGKPE
eukprot:Plantae.Rhodophyta-Hildenbrandia_rubra.ctg1870.p2 GENE.Plantae.Rhodophyta-Hildenbrandia_rubra.ctg1870~~Plantae.Rhodophyta-Hildenbrandia_rubra.ctg1870.p2  ORF type:complete len:233 (-),score=44.77 Plantae.Rhodophyta-Hildenbrandia_rubra.ctg1870:1016-1714(-)